MKTPTNVTPKQSDTSQDEAQTLKQQHEQILAASLPVNILNTLLSQLGVSVQRGELELACSNADQTLDNTPITRRVNFVFKALELKKIKVAQLRWRRFDQRCLPAMVFYQEQWQLISRGDNDALTITNSANEKQDIDEAMLEHTLLLWIKVAPKREQTSVFDFKDNVAARMVLKELFKDKHWLKDIVIATIIINLFAITTSLFAMQIYDRVVPTLAYSTLWSLVAGMGIIVSLDWLLKTIRARTLDSVSCAVDKNVSQQVFDHVMHLQLDTRPRSLGTLSAQVEGLNSVRQFFTSGVVFTLVDLPFALMFIGFIAVIGGHVGWVYMGLFPVALTLGWLTQKRLRNLLKLQMMRSNERQGLLVDCIQGTESIRSNNASWRFSHLWRDITVTISRYSIQQKAISNFATVTTGSLATLAYVAAIVVGVYQIEAGNITMGAMIACSILGGRVIAPISQSVQFMSQFQNVTQALQMVDQVLKLPTERKLHQNLLIPDEVPKNISLQEIQFSYPESPVKQLNVPDLSFTAGEKVVLLGPIGSGKSTLLKVLAGLYKPSTGRVRLGQTDLWEIDPNSVADHVSYLPQSVHLFKGTLQSNLTLSGAVSDSTLLSVVHDLGIDRIIADSPQGMALEISEGGEGLSGGQRQLVGLGRVLIGQPKIWLLDEPTASLDNETEAQVLAAINKYVRSDDILLISTHKPAIAAKLATRVIVMQGGEISADGKPELILSSIMRSKQKKTKNLVKQTTLNKTFEDKGPMNVI